MPVYVDSNNVSGTYDGASWGTAYQSLSNTTSVAVGTEIWVASDHNEDPGATVSWHWSNGTRSNPVKILSVSSTDDSLELSSTATVEQSVAGRQVNFAGFIFVYGITLHAADYLRLQNLQGKKAVYEQCTFKIVVTTSRGIEPVYGGAPSETHMIDCVLDLSGHANYKLGTTTSTIGSSYAKGCTILTNASSAGLIHLWARGNQSWEDCTFESTGTFISYAAIAPTTAIFRRCSMSYTSLAGTVAAGVEIRLENCDSGAVSNPPLGILDNESYEGTVKSVLTPSRTGGASDGERVRSWEMTTNANAAEMYNALSCQSVVRWVEAGSQTLTIYYANEFGGADLYDDDFWLEVSSPSEIASPNQTAQGNFQSTRAEPLATPVVNDDDTTSTWGGTQSNPQSVSVTINPTEPGPVTVRCFLAKPSTTVYVDPKIGVA